MKRMGWGEYPAREIYKEEGYDVIHLHGVLDLILLKDGKIEFVEIKSKGDSLNENQRKAIKLLKKHGFEARVERVTAKPSREYEGCHIVYLTRGGRRSRRYIWPDHLIYPSDLIKIK